MTTNTYQLPQLSLGSNNQQSKDRQSKKRLFITDGGLETDLIFQ